jgi:tetratricopeptide (TPR) repeat protein
MAVLWGFINLRQSEHFQLLPNQGGVALYLGNKRTADGMTPEQDRRITTGARYEDSIEVWAREEYAAAMRAQGREPSPEPMAISHYWTQRTKEEIRADPVRWMKLMAKKTWLNFWNAEIPNNKAFAFLQAEFFWLRIPPVRWVVLLVLAPAGLWLAWRRGSRDALVVLASYAALYTAGNILFFICDRYRYPVWPALAVFAGGGLVLLLDAIRNWRPRRLAWISASIVGLAVLSLHNWFEARLPTFARDYLFRSLAWYQRGQFTPALQDIDQSLQLDPRDVNAIHHRGNVLFALGRHAEARGAYEQVLQAEPEEASTWNNLGATLEALGKVEEALAAYQRATECRPPSQNAFFGIALLHLRAGRTADARGVVERFEKSFPAPDPAMLMIKAALARGNGDTRLAEECESLARRKDASTAEWAADKVAQARKP